MGQPYERIVSIMKGKNNQILPEFYMNEDLIFNHIEYRILFDLIACNCLAAVTDNTTYYPKEDVVHFVKKMFEGGVKRLGITINESFTESLLHGKIESGSLYSYLNFPLNLDPDFKDYKSFVYTLPLLLLIPTPESPPSVMQSNMFVMIALHCGAKKYSDPYNDIEADVLSAMMYTKNIISFHAERSELRGTQWQWFVLDILKQYAILYLSALVKRNPLYSELSLIPNQAYTFTLGNHRRIVKLFSNNSLQKGN